MSEPGLEVKVALLEQRLETVESAVQDFPQTFASKKDVELALAQVALSKDEMRQVLREELGAEKQAKRNWIVELIKVAGPLLGAGGIYAIIQLFQQGGQ